MLKKTNTYFEINMDDSKLIYSLTLFYIILFLYYCTNVFLVSIYSQYFKKLLPLSQIHINYMTCQKKFNIFNKIFYMWLKSIWHLIYEINI